MNSQHHSTPIDLPPDNREINRQAGSERLLSAVWDYLPVALVALVSLGVTLGMFMQSLNWERRQAEIAFREASQIRILLIQRDLNFSTGVVKDLASLFEASEVVGRREFRKFVAPALKNRTGLKSLAWAPQVPENRFKEFMADARRSFPKFSIRELDGPGFVEHADHYPVLYVQPYSENRSLLGLDLISDAHIMALFRDALTSHQQQISVKPMGRGSLPSEISVAIPVYYNEEEDIENSTAQASLRSHERFWDIQVHQNRFDL
ncbi:MAG: CHASE domain-containing protein [Candidatus Thiodiazotropha sp.]